MSEINLPVKRFRKGDLVFGSCKNDLPWPARIIRLYEESYNVQFIGHSSSAVLDGDSLVPFDEESIKEVVNCYKMINEKNTNKVLKAINMCKAEAQKMKKQKENLQARSKKQKKPKRRSNRLVKTNQNNAQTEEKEPFTVNQQKIIRKILKKHPKMQYSIQRAVPVDQQAENELLKQYQVSIDDDLLNLKQRQIQQFQPNIISQLKYQQESPEDISHHCQKYQEKSFEEVPLNRIEEMAEDQQLEIVVALEPEEKIEQQHPQQLQQPEQSEQPQQPQQPQKPQQHQEAEKNEMNEQNEECQGSMVVHFDEKSARSFETKEIDIEQTAVQNLCLHLRKMTDFLQENTSKTLCKEDKMEFAIMLHNHRRLTYHPELLSHMVDFFLTFGCKDKVGRKHFLIEYVKIKERLETCLLLRSKFSYDEQTNEILDRYLNKTHKVK